MSPIIGVRSSTAQDHGLTVGDLHARGYFTGTKDWLVDHIGSEKYGRRNRDARRRIHTDGIDRAAIVNESFELDDLRHEV